MKKAITLLLVTLVLVFLLSGCNVTESNSGTSDSTNYGQFNYGWGLDIGTGEFSYGYGYEFAPGIRNNFTKLF